MKITRIIKIFCLKCGANMGTAAIVIGIISLVASGVQFGVSQTQKKKAREEAETLAEQNREDDLKQQKIDNRRREKAQTISDESLKIEKRLFRQQQEEDRRNLLQDKKRKRIEDTQELSDNLSDVPESTKFKFRQLNRY